jgi:hypothetical protein
MGESPAKTSSYELSMYVLVLRMQAHAYLTARCRLSQQERHYPKLCWLRYNERSGVH